MARKKNKLISIIVPCFNEEEVLPLFYEEITKVLNEIDLNYELIFINDGSRDNTLQIMESLSNKDSNVLYFSFSRNFGKESAMYAGLSNANGDYVGFIDADLQHPPVLIKDMIKILDSGKYECAACRRIDRLGDSKVRTFFAHIFYRIVNKISDAQMVDGAGDYRLMTRKMANAILSLTEYNRFSKGIFSWVGFDTCWINYENVDRAAGISSWSFIKLVKYAIDGLISFSTMPLELSIFFGILFILSSVLYLLITLICQNCSAIIFLILLIGGLLLFCIGIVGEYIGKIFKEVKNRPHFIISKTNKKDAVCIK